MKLQKAMSSGKPYRMNSWGKKYPLDWYVTRKCDAKRGTHLWWMGNNFMGLSEIGVKQLIREINSNNWEIKK